MWFLKYMPQAHHFVGLVAQEDGASRVQGRTDQENALGYWLYPAG
jgi:hypothetical protein